MAAELTILKGQSVRLRALFAVGGVLTDPTTVTLTVTDPDLNQEVFTYALGQITRDGQGDFSKLYTPDDDGTWFFMFESTGAVIAAKSAYIIVEPYPG